MISSKFRLLFVGNRYILKLPNRKGAKLVDDLDDEWVALIIEAISLGATIEDVRQFIEENTKDDR